MNKELIQKLKMLVPSIIGLASIDGYRRTVQGDIARAELSASTKRLDSASQKLERLYTEVSFQKENIGIIDAKAEASQARLAKMLEQFHKDTERANIYREAPESNQNILEIEFLTNVKAEKASEL